MQDDLLDYNLVVVGKTGSGKSWVCNRLLGVRDGRGPFRVYHGMEGQTVMAQSEVIMLRRNRRLHVIDTPDMFNLDENDAKRRFRKWEQLIVSPGHIAFLFIVRLDERFTSNDYELYKRYRELLPKHLRNNVILGFTRVDDLPGPVEDQITLSSVKTLLSDCQQRYVTFTVPRDELTGDQAQVEQTVEEIMDWMTKMTKIPSKISWVDRCVAYLMSGVSRLSRINGHFTNRIRRAIGVSPSTCVILVIGAAAFLIFLYFYVYHAGTDQSQQSYNSSQANRSDLKK